MVQIEEEGPLHQGKNFRQLPVTGICILYDRFRVLFIVHRQLFGLEVCRSMHITDRSLGLSHSAILHSAHTSFPMFKSLSFVWVCLILLKVGWIHRSYKTARKSVHVSNVLGWQISLKNQTVFETNKTICNAVFWWKLTIIERSAFSSFFWNTFNNLPP